MADVLEPSDPADELLADEVVAPDPETDLAEFSESELATPAPQPYGRSWAFDFPAGRFRRSPGGPTRTLGVDTVRFWIEKCLRTARGAHPVYGPDYGVERPGDLIGSHGDDPELALTVAERIEGALLFHPKIAEVRDVEVAFDAAEEALGVTFTVVLDDDSAVAVTDFPLQ